MFLRLDLTEEVETPSLSLSKPTFRSLKGPLSRDILKNIPLKRLALSSRTIAS